ncbi:MAG: alpha-glucan family phosphorylase, partial [Acidimicrobiales bacterium]
GAQLWRADVGRVRLYLLDSDIPTNPADLRSVTDRLYGGDIEHRLVQEILLGMGGVRALDAVGEKATVFHSNEGHAGFLGLERIRGLIQRHAMSFEEALEATRAGTVFTTHTPVPAGIDRFPVELMEKYFSSWAGECDISMAQFMELGHFPDEDYSEPFNMAVMGLRLAGSANGVSRLHGSVSREMFAPLWAGLDADEVPIGSVTNGVHAPSWVSGEMAGVLAGAVGQSWADCGPRGWGGVADLDDQVLWQVRQAGRAHLVDFVRARLGTGLGELLDPATLTIGFARRFATYKRATLLLSDPDRLRRLITAPERRVQFVFAGKAHPADDEGKEMIRRISDFAIEADVSDHFVFIPDYDIAVARALYQGCDVWLNTPRRPMEACGTSGEKAALNGSLNLSVLDGWWAEYFDGTNGWAVPTAGYSADLDGRDATEAETLFRILENQVVPAFYNDRTPGQGPPAWLKLVKASLVTLGPEVSAARMVKDYATELYLPAARRAEDLAADDFQRARDLAAWKSRVVPAWANVEVVRVWSTRGPLGPGGPLHVTAWVDLAGLVPKEVCVEAIHGPVNAEGEMTNPTVEVMDPAPDAAEYPRGTAFGVEIDPGRAGPYGYTVRARPVHPDLGCPAEGALAPRFLAGA